MIDLVGSFGVCLVQALTAGPPEAFVGFVFFAFISAALAAVTGLVMVILAWVFDGYPLFEKPLYRAIAQLLLIGYPSMVALWIICMVTYLVNALWVCIFA